jgi:hypothetical protein
LSYTLNALGMMYIAKDIQIFNMKEWEGVLTKSCMLKADAYVK